MLLVGYGTWPITHGSLCVFCNFVRLISQLKICDASQFFSLPNSLFSLLMQVEENSGASEWRYSYSSSF